MIARMILVYIPPERAAEAVRLWKEECAPLMIKQPGCLNEELLRGRENPGELISLSTWQDQAAIDRYRGSDAHKEIQQLPPRVQRLGRETRARVGERRQSRG